MSSPSQRDSAHLGSTQIQRLALMGDSSSGAFEQFVHGASHCLANHPDKNLHDQTSLFENNEHSLSMNPLSQGEPAQLGSQQIYPLALTGDSSSQPSVSGFEANGQPLQVLSNKSTFEQPCNLALSESLPVQISVILCTVLLTNPSHVLVHALLPQLLLISVVHLLIYQML